ncbi:KLRG1 protein, partial [Penelope pileata]|nr:KLRG1 protein [Penelope pileata]
VFQKTPPPQHYSETRGRNGMELCVSSSILQYFCPTTGNSSAVHAGCQLCPQFWQLFGDQCFWLSKAKGTWKRGRKDCKNWDSQLVVLQNKAEMVNIEWDGSKQHVWIGLKGSNNTWKWVDNSSFNATWFGAQTKLANGCGTLRDMMLEDDSCNGEHEWVCQKKPFLLLP